MFVLILLLILSLGGNGAQIVFAQEAQPTPQSNVFMTVTATPDGELVPIVVQQAEDMTLIATVSNFIPYGVMLLALCLMAWLSVKFIQATQEYTKNADDTVKNSVPIDKMRDLLHDVLENAQKITDSGYDRLVEQIKTSPGKTDDALNTLLFEPAMNRLEAKFDKLIEALKPPELPPAQESIIDGTLGDATPSVG